MKNKEKYCNKSPFDSVIAYTTLSRQYVIANPKNTDRFPSYSDWMEMEAEDADYSKISEILAEELFKSIKNAGIDLNSVSGLKQAVDKFGIEIENLSLMLDVERKWRECVRHEELKNLRNTINKEE